MHFHKPLVVESMSWIYRIRSKSRKSPHLMTRILWPSFRRRLQPIVKISRRRLRLPSLRKNLVNPLQLQLEWQLNMHSKYKKLAKNRQRRRKSRLRPRLKFKHRPLWMKSRSYCLLAWSLKLVKKLRPRGLPLTTTPMHSFNNIKKVMNKMASENKHQVAH